MMRLISRIGGLCLAIAALTSAATTSIAQGGQLAEARHKGTYNYLRVAPNRRAHIVEKMPQGTRFMVVGEQANYYAVILDNGLKGWTAAANVAFIHN